MITKPIQGNNLQLELFDKSRIQEIDWGNGRLIQCGTGICTKNGAIHRTWMHLEAQGIFFPTHEQWTLALKIIDDEILKEHDSVLPCTPQNSKS